MFSLPPLHSYSQNLEDVILWRALGHVEKGFYIDIGAQHPRTDSVSRGFYEKGWRGVHVEPVRFYADLLRQDRPDEDVREVLVGASEEAHTFFIVPDTGLSTADEGVALENAKKGFRFERREVPAIRLASLLDAFREKDIHWLKIDVEGFESAVVEGWTPSEVRPWIVVIESTKPLTREPSHQEWEPVLIGLGYTFVYFDGLNRFYVSDKQAALQDAFGLPPNVFDNYIRFDLGAQQQISQLANQLARLRELNNDPNSRTARDVIRSILRDSFLLISKIRKKGVVSLIQWVALRVILKVARYAASLLRPVLVNRAGSIRRKARWLVLGRRGQVRWIFSRLFPAEVSGGTANAGFASEALADGIEKNIMDNITLRRD